jgi:phospholipid/cholesterol/gamma-HCH transport system substrate-binding protein
MAGIRKEVKIGVTVVGSLAILLWGLNFLKGVNIFSSSNTYYALYDEVQGLNVSSPIMVNGFKVGKVMDLKFHPEMDGRILVKFSVEEGDFLLPSNTRAKITSLDLLGSKSIDLVLPKKVEGYLANGDTLVSEVERSITDEVNAQIAPLKKKAEDLLASIDTAVTVVKVILNKQAREDLRSSFTSIKNTFHTFEVLARRIDTLTQEEKAKIGMIMNNVQSISNNIRNNNENITAILDNFRLISDSLAMSNLTTAVNNASVALTAAADIMRKIDEGEGTVGKLVNDDSLYIHLSSAARDLDKLLIDLEAHPKRYVHFSIFGRKDSRPKEKKKDKNKDKK